MGDNTNYTKYEKARILGARALQLAMGAPPLVKPKGSMSVLDLAIEEFKKGVIPITVIGD
ncbi:MAG: DNA-directed RNA polymerase subunit K [Candidatus Diapherotrites archaeon]|nr:DNA-directed RNA polymerase subunit K [Candidatus Diapherotrites archaeon]